MEAVDAVRLNFSPEGLRVLNAVLGLVMFGVALDIRIDDFKRVAVAGKGALIGLLAQFFALPAFTYLLILLLEPQPSMALGMMLVAACPGGNISNFLAHHARANVALSVTMSAVSTAASAFMTPFNIAFWGSMYPPTRAILRDVSLDPVQMFLMVLTILGIPLALGMTLAARKPVIADRLRKPMNRLSLLVFAIFIGGALFSNFQYFLRFFGLILGLIALHNAIALLTGYWAARAAGLDEPDRRAVAIEIGIQNSGLGLILIFNFFDGLGGMAIVAAGWGIWHMVSGLTLATWWNRKTKRAELL